MQKYRRSFSERAPKTVSWEREGEVCLRLLSESKLSYCVREVPRNALFEEWKEDYLPWEYYVDENKFPGVRFIFFFRQKMWIILNTVCRRKPSTALSLNTDEEVGIFILCIIYRCSPRRSKHQNVSKFVYCYSESSTGAVVNPTTLGHCRHHNLHI